MRRKDFGSCGVLVGGGGQRPRPQQRRRGGVWEGRLLPAPAGKHGGYMFAEENLDEALRGFLKVYFYSLHNVDL